jgi:hypothetical protein
MLYMLDITQDSPKGFTTRFSDSEVRSAHQEKSLLLLVLVTGFAFNALFESFFQRQSGIVFYSFWIPLLVMYVNQHQLGNRK